MCKYKMLHYFQNHWFHPQLLIIATIINIINSHHHHHEATKATATDWVTCSCKTPSHLLICLCLSTKMDIGHTHCISHFKQVKWVSTNQLILNNGAPRMLQWLQSRRWRIRKRRNRRWRNWAVDCKRSVVPELCKEHKDWRQKSPSFVVKLGRNCAALQV